MVLECITMGRERARVGLGRAVKTAVFHVGRSTGDPLHPQFRSALGYLEIGSLTLALSRSW